MSTEPGNNAKNNFQKRFFKLMKNVIFRKKYEKCEKSQRYQTCNNWSKKELFSVRTKLSCNKKFCEKLLAIEMKR